MKLTGYQQTKRGMIALFFDGEFAFSMPPDAFAQSRLQIGCEVDERRLGELAFQAQEKKARSKALELLSYRAYTRSDLTKRLLQKFDDEQAVESAVAHMQELGYINDAAYAKSLAEKLLFQKGYGKYRIRQELILKGVERDCVDETMDALEFDEDDTLQTIREFIAKKYPGAYDDDGDRRRATAALCRRGFTYGDIRRAMEEADYEL